MTPQLAEALTRLLSRKFLISLTALFLVTFALQVDPSLKLNFILGIVGIFATANVVNSIGTATKATVDMKQTTTPQSTTVEKKTETPVSPPVPIG